ncbi:hypothetical protein CIW60_12850 [Enterobacter roggenkampii]|uniref:oxidoreductase n=1 Tax=Enterobacter roggenkampii TaxID=1812935 RepID=UPI000BA87305|nr:oxidoreductase [Enterobacter roggenkampii]PAO09848.1 hypothetical protein CIW60_12850 [Enterobacter roggenkampii]
MSKLNQRPMDYASEGNALESSLRAMIGNYAFIDIVRVEAVTGDTLTVKSLVQGLTSDRKAIGSEPTYGVPYLRLQRGSSAVIMDPVVGDIGLVAVCDRDITNVKANKTESVPQTLRTHARADAVYLTGIASLNQTPTQYARFNESGINVVSPVKVNINAPDVDITGTSSLALNSPNIILNGPITQGAGSYAGAAHFKNAVTSDTEVSVGAIRLTYHGHNGVQTGSGTSGAPVAI